jgi:hypothetical protein
MLNFLFSISCANITCVIDIQEEDGMEISINSQQNSIGGSRFMAFPGQSSADSGVSVVAPAVYVPNYVQMFLNQRAEPKPLFKSQVRTNE